MYLFSLRKFCYTVNKETILTQMAKRRKVVQLEYKWIHPTLGEVVVRSSGRRSMDCDGMIVLEVYHRIFSNIEEV
jgi:hypothetical protein